MLQKVIYFLDKKYGHALDGEPWVIEKSNKLIGACILSLKVKETIYSYDWTALISISLLTSVSILAT